jgi:hypothetical protein
MTRQLCDISHGHIFPKRGTGNCERCDKPKARVLCNRHGHPKSVGGKCPRCGARP